MVTRSQVGGPSEEEGQGTTANIQVIQVIQEGAGALGGTRALGGAGASGTTNPIVPLSDYEALKSEENRRMI